MERAYALIFQLFLFLSRPQPNSSPEHYLQHAHSQNFETIPSFDGDDLHLARLCAIHIVKTIVWELDSIPESDPQRIKYPNVFEDAKGLSMLCEQFLKDQDSVPETWTVFWAEAQQALVALGMDLGDAGYAIQAPPDPIETPDADPEAPGLTRAEGFKGVDLTGKAGAPVRGAPNILETAQPGDDVPDRIEMGFEANGKEKPDETRYWEKNSKSRGLFYWRRFLAIILTLKCPSDMESSTLTLPVNALSALPNANRISLSKPPENNSGRATAPSRRHSDDQEAIEMDTLGEKPLESASASLHQEVPAWTMSTKNEWIAIMACCSCLFMAGWNDATTGPLLPTIQAHYRVNFTVVSMLFVSGCVGFISAAVVNIHLTDRLGFGKVIFLGAMLQVFAYSVLTPALPFPAMCVAYAINGFGMALQDAQSSGFVAELPNNASAKMGLLHAFYGAGAFISPLVATQFAQLPRWSFHYLSSLGVAVVNATALLVVFRFRRQHEVMGLPDPDLSHPHNSSHGDSSNGSNKYKQIFGSRAVQLMAFFIWVYVGVEVTIGGWIVTFVIEERGGGPSAGYISSGFFAAKSLSRCIRPFI
ncbi:unnamed protein product [Rhizoctonia solani]|uniref:Major facilitator superfamily (MFS) profile domain-containing protein n=1 Tax=Rhizoctonia solani TaxID=456999 RepID=A0A8H2WV79_9AGAM|nr:unnamed protein product [Rhizoctonia solani]